jgi:hypothetical protein
MTLNIEKSFSGSFGAYPNYGTGMLNSVKEIHFYVLCSERLNEADFVENVIQ